MQTLRSGLIVPFGGYCPPQPKRTARTAKPFDILLKLNFGEGCSCVCTQIKFTVDFQRNDSTRVGFCISDDMFYGGQNERRNAEYRNI
ncbi:uncharacterized protein LOC127794303 isoform X5 [Diospyros lotus]|uniref:uncharacterized protein LOC127794303 isoform X5 n=1 Tax=Diospyros lotus TaxID=55363 RepID=UPI0022541B0A|nr:uncharacterized protein LOC127794303 isoform X5 [Diospyros lotus]XP_052181249.1 uncharacterized protein LOC127794303 isoform X5 [Diospyros lotus]